jgi:hypothetical protein
VNAIVPDLFGSHGRIDYSTHDIVRVFFPVEGKSVLVARTPAGERQLETGAIFASRKGSRTERRRIGQQKQSRR